MVLKLDVEVCDKAVECGVGSAEPVGDDLGLQPGADLDDIHLVLFDVAGAGEPLDDLPRVLEP